MSGRKIGWIGLGSIGTAMVHRLLAAGHEVTVYARGVGQEAVVAAGAHTTPDYVALAAGCEMLGICVFRDAQLEEALLASGALAAMRPGSVLAVHTTGSPTLAREIAEAAPTGVETLDACFSGGPHDVAEGALTLMIGGTAEGLDRAGPMLGCYADKLFHVGPAGAGQTAKLLNNLLFATNLRFASEIMRLARDQGLDPALTAQVIQKSSGASMGAGMFQSGRSPEEVMAGVGKYMTKDVQAAEAAANALSLDFSLFGPVLDFYR